LSLPACASERRGQFGEPGIDPDLLDFLEVFQSLFMMGHSIVAEA
jgi:hypothetical protein